MQRAFLWIFLFALFGVIAYAVGLNRGSMFDVMTGDDFASMFVKIAGLVLVGGAAISVFRESFAQAIRYAAIWALIALVLVIGYTFRHEISDVSDRVLVELIPGRPVTRGRTVELARRQGGDFQVTAEINGTRMSMVLDTGASSVVLTNEAAKAAGLPLEMIKYTVNVDTANGRTRAAAVTLDKLTIGGITERAVPALIAQPGQLRTNLLGMSFLNRLQSWEVRGDKLVMRAYP
jgi:aspartyl protease family protein